MRLLEIQENGVKDRPTHVCQMMGQLSLEGAVPHTTYRLETMEAVVVLDRRGQLPVDDTSCGLPQDLLQPNALEVLAIPLGDQHDHMPGTCLGQGPFPKRRLRNFNHLLLVGSIRVHLPRCPPEPLVEMLCPHSRWPFRAVQA